MKYAQKAECSDKRVRTVRTYTDIDEFTEWDGIYGNTRVKNASVSGVLCQIDEDTDIWYFFAIEYKANYLLLPPPYHNGSLRHKRPYPS